MHRPSKLELGGPFRSGELIADKYRLESPLASGGMGVLMLASQLGLGRKVVIKVLREDAMTSADVVARFVREARTAATLQGDHVVRVVDVGALPSGAPYFVMEHLEGCDLSDELKQRGPLPAREAVDWLLQACEALAEAHRRGIIHRDLKPSNLFLARSPDGSRRLKVLDFGISKVTLEPDDPPLTATRSVLGTPDYMSPEQVRDFKNVDTRSDIWSLGVVLYELLSEKRPFEAQSASGLCVAIATEPHVPLRKRRSDISPALESIVHACLEKDPSRRYASIADLSRALSPFASESARIGIGRIDAISSGQIRSDSATGSGDQSALAQAETNPYSWPTYEAPTALQRHAERVKSRPRLLFVLASLGILGIGAVIWYVTWAPQETPLTVESSAAASLSPQPFVPVPEAPATAAVSASSPVDTAIGVAPSAAKSVIAAARTPAPAKTKPTPRPVSSSPRPGGAENDLAKKAFSDRK